jgi:hypothetical protein
MYYHAWWHLYLSTITVEEHIIKWENKSNMFSFLLCLSNVLLIVHVVDELLKNALMLAMSMNANVFFLSMAGLYKIA